MRSTLAAWCGLAVASCTSAATPPEPVRAECAVVAPVVRQFSDRLIVRDGLVTHETSPLPSDAVEFLHLLREMDAKGELRPACSGGEAVLAPGPDAPVGSVLATLRALSSCGGTVGVPLVESAPPVSVYGLHFCHVPPETMPKPKRCSHVRVDVSAEEMHVQRYARGYPLASVPPWLPPRPAEDQRPLSLDVHFTGAPDTVPWLETLDAPHAGLSLCDTASFRIEPQLRWAEVEPLLAAFHEATGLSMVLD
ncbi:MAG: hypothetical protein AAGA54_08575 [Myxococcota bacterium]